MSLGKPDHAPSILQAPFASDTAGKFWLLINSFPFTFFKLKCQEIKQIPTCDGLVGLSLNFKSVFDYRRAKCKDFSCYRIGGS